MAAFFVLGKPAGCDCRLSSAQSEGEPPGTTHTQPRKRLNMAFKQMILAAAAAFAMILSAMPAGAQGTSADEDGQYRWIDIVNRSPVPIHYFYMTDVDTRSWGNDLLGRRGTVEPGRVVRVFPNRVQSARGYCRFDIRVGFANGSRVERRQVNLCRAQAVVCTSTQSCAVR